MLHTLAARATTSCSRLLRSEPYEIVYNSDIQGADGLADLDSRTSNQVTLRQLAHDVASQVSEVSAMSKNKK